MPSIPTSKLDSTRREFLLASGATAAAAAIGFSPPAHGDLPRHLLDPSKRAPNYSDEILFLVNRITQGHTVPEQQLATGLGFDGYLEYQLAPENIDDSEVEQLISTYTTLGMSHRELYIKYARLGFFTPRDQLKSAAMIRAAFSKRQLLERMVEFWSDHFNSYHDDELLPWLKTVDDREVIRRHALGKFPDMVRASARSGAMVWYLDNYLNTKEAPNENYGRELLELHTMGVNGGYHEFDIKNVARCFTGWTVKLFPWIDIGEFVYNNAIHDNNQKLVLGNVIPAGGGESDGDAVIDIITTHPSTAHFISKKMARWFLSYDPPERIVQSVAQTYMNTGGDIKEMIRTLFQTARASTTEPWGQLKFRRPFHFVTSLLRMTGATFSGGLGRATDSLKTRLLAMGHLPFNRITPDGYPDTLEHWASTMLPRWSFAADLLDNSIPGIHIEGADLIALMGDWPRDQWAVGVNRLLMGGAMPYEDQRLVQLYVDEATVFNETVAREAVALGASSPSFQYY